MRYVFRLSILFIGLMTSACFKNGEVQTELSSFIQTNLTAYPIAYSGILEDTEFIVPLSYSDTDGRVATFCAVTTTNFLTVTTPCACDVSGFCSVGVKGANNYYGGGASFTYQVGHDVISNEALATLSIDNVNDAPVLSQGCMISPSDGELFLCQPVLTEPDNDNGIVWGLTIANTCGWLGIDPVTGTLSGTPSGVGPCTVDLFAYDGVISTNLNFVLNVTHGDAAQVVFSAIANHLAGNTVNFLVMIKDMYGNIVHSGPDSTAMITVSKISGPVAPLGTLSVAAVSGVATFSMVENVNFEGAGNYTLSAEKSDRSGMGGVGILQGSSSAFQIFANSPYALAFSTEPSVRVTAGEDLLPVVEIQDVYGNLVNYDNATTVSLGIATNPNAGILSGVTSKVAQSGVVTWTGSDNLFIDRAGAGYELTALATGLSSATSRSLTVDHGPADHLVWTSQPFVAVIGASLSAQVEIYDSYGNLVQNGVDSGASVSLSIDSGAGSLVGSTTVSAVSGVAQFTGLSLTTPGNVTLLASKMDMTGVGGAGVLNGSSGSITVSLPAQLTITDGPSYDFGTIMAGASINKTLTVTNTGGATATNISPDALSGAIGFYGGNYPGLTGNCGVMLLPGDNCWVIIRFSPTTPIVSSDTLTIHYNDGVGMTSVARGLVGTGAPNPPPTIGRVSCFENAFEDQFYSCQALALSGVGDIGDGIISWSLAMPVSHECAWVSIDPSTGVITGTPTSNDVGVCDIHVKVSDGFNPDSTVWPIRVHVVGRSEINSFSQGYQLGCATKNGKAYCWGFNGVGQLGDGTSTDSYVPVAVNSLDSGVDLISVSRGNPNGFVCARVVDTSLVRDEVVCWGYGADGQLGNGVFSNSNTPVVVSGLLGSSVVSLGVGASHACALLTSGQVKCWGKNNLKQLGDNTTTNRNAPVLVGNLTLKAIGLSVGIDHSCALMEDATINCWGRGASGQLGQDSTANLGVAQPVIGYGVGLRQAISVAAGGLHTCSILMDGQVQCWGGNSAGQLGVGSTVTYGDFSGEMNSIAYTNLGTGQKALQLSLGYAHTCAQLMGGGIKCWGENNLGQLGYGHVSRLGDVPNEMGDSLALVSLDFDFLSSISLGYSSSCALGVASGTSYLKCWGDNSVGALGAGMDPSVFPRIGDAPGETGSNLQPVAF